MLIINKKRNTIYLPRPKKCCRVAFLPQTTYFKPAGIPLSVLDEVTLSLEEAESIRLKDIDGLEQEDGARKMNISRPTFQRILASARQKMADAILHGKAIRIDGGNFELSWQRFRCFKGHEWDMAIDAKASNTPNTCPTCSTANVAEVPLMVGGHGYYNRGRHRGAGRGRQ